MFQHKSNYVAFMILQVSVLGGTREAGSMNYQFHNCNMKDSKNLYMSNSTGYLEKFNTLIEWASF